MTIDNACKAYGDQVLLEDACLALTDTMRVGLVGRNGAGKSTLLRCVLGQEELDAGAVDIMPDMRIAYLEQHDDFEPDETVQAWLERRTGEPDWKCGEIAGRFDIKSERLVMPIKQLSGGWQTRAKLAAMLLTEPDLLILDEPTNFLDLRTQLLLEQFLSGWRGAALVVSHDRAFLNACCSHVCELAFGELTLFEGNLDAYDARRAENRERAERTNATIDSKAKQLQRFIDSNRANANTAAQARNKAKQLEKLLEQKEQVAAEAKAPVRFSVPSTGLTPGPSLRIRDLQIGYDHKAIATCDHFECDRGTRAVVVGDNGQGKTTLLRTLVGDLPAVGGSHQWTHGAVLGIYAQHVFGTMPEHQTVEEYLHTKAPTGTPTQDILAVAGGFLFRDEAVRKPIQVLSGGERARLVLAGLLLGKHTVLILDEPTNHLDVESVEALATALRQWDGTVFVASHDRSFCRIITDGVIEVADGGVAWYPGAFDLYEYRLQQELASADGAAVAAAKPVSAEERKRRNKRRYELDKMLGSLDRRLNKLNARKAELDELLATATERTQRDEMAAELAKVTNELIEVEEGWLAASEEREELA